MPNSVVNEIPDHPLYQVGVAANAGRSQLGVNPKGRAVDAGPGQVERILSQDGQVKLLTDRGPLLAERQREQRLHHLLRLVDRPADALCHVHQLLLTHVGLGQGHVDRRSHDC